MSDFDPASKMARPSGVTDDRGCDAKRALATLGSVENAGSIAEHVRSYTQFRYGGDAVSTEGVWGSAAADGPSQILRIEPGPPLSEAMRHCRAWWDR